MTNVKNIWKLHVNSPYKTALQKNNNKKEKKSK